MPPFPGSDPVSRLVFEQAGDFAFLLEPAADGLLTIVDANAAALRAHGFSREELIGQPLTVIDPGVHVEPAALADLRAGKTLTFEVRHRRRDGSSFDVEVRSTMAVVDGHELILSVERDITGRKQAESRLKHWHDLMSYVISHARSAIAVHDRDMKYVYVSERYLKDYNVRERDVIGRHHYDVFPDLPQKWRDVHQRVLKGETLGAEEDPYFRDDGTLEWTRWECRPWYEADGVIGGLIVYTEVITDRIRSAKQLEERERELRRSQALAHVGHWVLNLATGTAYWSDELKRIFGLDVDAAIENPVLTTMELVHPEDRDLMRGAVEGLIRDGTNPPVIEYRIVRPTGEVRYVRGVPGDRITGEDGTVTSVSGVIQDITELRLSEGERKKLVEQLHQAMKMEAVGRLAGGVAHDFNNLLTSILGNIEMALLDLPASHQLAETLKEVGDAAQRAAALTRQLLAFSRRQLIEPRVLNLNELVSHLHRMLERLIGEDVNLRTIPAADLGVVRVDPGQFEQVLVNLAVNARDAMPDGGHLVIETANIDLGADYCAIHPQARPGPHVMMAVSDTGHGMDAQVKEHLFEPFFTTKPLGRGTGLGLATIFGTVKQAGGFIEVYSEVGTGTSFKIYLPRVEGSPQSIVPTLVSADMPGGHETILVVEDEALVREVLVRLLKRLGYRVIEAGSGAEAIELATACADRIDVLLTDVVMPGMNGREVATRLGPIHPEARILFASGYTENIIVHHGVVDEGLNFIAKPYSPASMAKKLRSVLDGSGV